MQKILVGITLFMGLMMQIFAVQAEEVLVVRWMENAEGDQLFQKRLKELRPNVNFRYVDAKRDRNNLVKQLQNYDFSKVDLVYSFSTTGTKIVRGYLKGQKPLVFSAVSTPVLSGIADSIEKPGHNLTGAKMLIDLETQIDVLTRLKDIKTIALWFDPREKQSQPVLIKLQKILEGKGITPKLFRIIPDADQFDDMLAKASEESNKLDALYFVAAASYANQYAKFHSKLNRSLLTMGVIVDYVKEGATIALGPDVVERSYTVAEQAAKILAGASAGEIPVSLVTKENAKLYVNRAKLTEAGIKDISGLGLKVVELDVK